MTRRARRIALTSGMRGWARHPYDPDRDPSLPPDPDTELENDTMSTDHTLTPADIANRCRILGAEVTTAQGGLKYRVVPPADVTTPDGNRPETVFIPMTFRGKADRSDTIGHLRRNGLDVTADRNWSENAKDGSAPNPAPEIPKLEPIEGKRPNPSWTKVPTPAQSPEVVRALQPTLAELDRSDEIIGLLTDELSRIVVPLAERLDKLAARVDALEVRAPAGSPRAEYARRVDQLDNSVGSLARRVAAAEGQVEAVTTGLGQANDALKVLVAKVSGNAARATNLGSEMNSVRQRLDALEVATSTEPVESESERFYRETRAKVVELLEALPVGMALPRASVADALGITEEDEAKRLSHVMRRMHGAGELRQHGFKSQTRWSLVQVVDVEAKDGDH